MNTISYDNTNLLMKLCGSCLSEAVFPSFSALYLNIAFVVVSAWNELSLWCFLVLSYLGQQFLEQLSFFC